jgi:predicted metal-dependent TIM-barrel fold hydrolase
VPKTANELKNQGYENSEIEKVASINAQKFFNL